MSFRPLHEISIPWIQVLKFNISIYIHVTIWQVLEGWASIMERIWRLLLVTLHGDWKPKG